MKKTLIDIGLTGIATFLILSWVDTRKNQKIETEIKKTLDDMNEGINTRTKDRWTKIDHEKFEARLEKENQEWRDYVKKEFERIDKDLEKKP